MLNRRSLFAGAAAAPVALSLPVVAVVSAERADFLALAKQLPDDELELVTDLMRVIVQRLGRRAEVPYA